MALNIQSTAVLSEEILDAIRELPVEKKVEHCGMILNVSPFDLYAACPKCGERLKLRSFSGATEIEDVFDAVFSWMNRPNAQEQAGRRQAVLADDD